MPDKHIAKTDNSQGWVRVYPEILLSAVKGNHGGAARLWHLARHKASGGCGAIPAKVLRRYVIKELGKPRADYDKWLSGSLAIGLLLRHKKNLQIIGLAKGAAILGVSHLKRPVKIQLDQFIGKGWLAWVWRGWLENNNLLGKPISRAALRGMSGIPERNQRDYEKLARVYNQANYAKHEGANSKEAIYDLLINKGRPVFDYQGQTLERLPNSRETNDQSITLAPEGRTVRANSQLKDLLNIGGRDPKQTITRLYCQGDKQKETILKRIMNLKNKGALGLPGWIYQATDQKRFWYAIPA